MHRSIIVAAAFVSGVGAACAQAPADGAAIVKANCGACHAISGAPPPAGPVGPSFVDIARMPSTTALSLKVFMRSSHRNMPNFIMNADEIDAVAAYILDLAQKQ